METLCLIVCLSLCFRAKKATSDAVSSSLIQHLFDVAMGAGAIAGKVSGAGGGGFIMFLVNPRKRTSVVRALEVRDMALFFLFVV